MASPIRDADPVTIFTTPGGNISAILLSVIAGASAELADGFTTTVFPAITPAAAWHPKLPTANSTEQPKQQHRAVAVL